MTLGESTKGHLNQIDTMKPTMPATPPDPGLWPVGEARQVIMVHLSIKSVIKSLQPKKQYKAKPESRGT